MLRTNFVASEIFYKKYIFSLPRRMNDSKDIEASD